MEKTTFLDRFKKPLLFVLESVKRSNLDGDRIIGGMGVIENNFHDRKDLTPQAALDLKGFQGRASMIVALVR